MMFSYLVLISLVFQALEGIPHNDRVVRQTGSTSCLTPNNEIGTCIILNSCQYLFNLLQTNGRDPQVTRLVANSKCGFHNNRPKVCCPRTSGNSFTSLITTPTTATYIPAATTYQTTKAKDNGVCGMTNKTVTKIVGGKPVDLVGDWPWIVALGYRTATRPGPLFNCGASLISNRWVVTAAHCVLYLPSGMQLIVARLGDLDLNDSIPDDANPVDINIQEVIPHPKYSRSPIINDIALLKLSKPVQFTAHIRPICVLSGETFKTDTYYKRKRPFIIGWGRIEQNGPSVTHLQESSINVVNMTYCAQAYSQHRTAQIDSSVICAGEIGIDTCQGDSGGPLMIPFPERKAFYLAGIVSYGIGCAHKDYPGVYTRVAAFAEWISQETGLIFD